MDKHNAWVYLFRLNEHINKKQHIYLDKPWFT